MLTLVQTFNRFCQANGVVPSQVVVEVFLIGEEARGVAPATVQRARLSLLRWLKVIATESHADAAE